MIEPKIRDTGHDWMRKILESLSPPIPVLRIATPILDEMNI